MDILSEGQVGNNIMPGVVIGIVEDTQDPEGLGRIKVNFPLLGNKIASDWIRMVSFFAGHERGAFFLPQKNDEVLIAFAFGNASMPYVIGALWNGVDKPPVAKAAQQAVSVIKTKSGSTLKFDDTANAEKITLTDKNSNTIEIDTKANKITISASKDIEIAAKKGTVSIVAQNFKVSSTNGATIKAKTAQLTADATLKIAGKIVNIN
jgi:uncharacterized protein involved in type VI secretion and phage assembly